MLRSGLFCGLWYLEHWHSLTLPSELWNTRTTAPLAPPSSCVSIAYLSKLIIVITSSFVADWTCYVPQRFQREMKDVYWIRLWLVSNPRTHIRLIVCLLHIAVCRLRLTELVLITLQVERKCWRGPGRENLYLCDWQSEDKSAAVESRGWCQCSGDCGKWSALQTRRKYRESSAGVRRGQILVSVSNYLAYLPILLDMMSSFCTRSIWSWWNVFWTRRQWIL